MIYASIEMFSLPKLFLKYYDIPWTIYNEIHYNEKLYTTRKHYLKTTLINII